MNMIFEYVLVYENSSERFNIDQGKCHGENFSPFSFSPIDL